MILDKRTEFCDSVALNTGAAGTYLLGDQIDLGAPARDIGTGEELYLVVVVSQAATSGGSATAQFTLASDDSASIATNGTASVHFQTAAIPLAQLTAGRVIAAVPLPMEGTVYERYLGILQTTGTAAFTGGRVDAFLTHDVARWKAYPDAI